MIDPEEVTQQHRALRKQRQSTTPTNPLPRDHATARQCLAMWRGDRWSVGAIASELGFPETHVRALIAQAITIEKETAA